MFWPTAPGEVLAKASCVSKKEIPTCGGEFPAWDFLQLRPQMWGQAISHCPPVLFAFLTSRTHKPNTVVIWKATLCATVPSEWHRPQSNGCGGSVVTRP